MDRQQSVERAYQRGQELTLSNKKYSYWLEQFFEREYHDDVGAGDITSLAVLTSNQHGKATLKAKQSGIVGGIDEVRWFFQKHDLNVRTFMENAVQIVKGQKILEIHGKEQKILATERIGLNVMQRMAGIATETRYLVNCLNDYPTRIAATRKAPFRYLDKKAVFIGGGLTHRFNLEDAILIKDNHLEAITNHKLKNPIREAITRAAPYANNVNFIEIETSHHTDAINAAKKFNELQLELPCIVMLDNMPPNEITEIIEELKKKNLYDSVLLEASGNITRQNIKAYAKTGIDVVSVGYLTHSARILDMDLELIR